MIVERMIEKRRGRVELVCGLGGGLYEFWTALTALCTRIHGSIHILNTRYFMLKSVCECCVVEAFVVLDAQRTGCWLPCRYKV